MKQLSYSETPVMEWQDPRLPVQLFVKLEYLNHPVVSGNKWWKLKYNLEEAHRREAKVLLTFGGAYSNHIFATAVAANELGIGSIGIIAGEEVSNPTLDFARSKGMRLHFITRHDYRRKTDADFIVELTKSFGDFYLIPEGGTNEQAIRGCAELGARLQAETPFDVLCLPVGTGGTMAGIVSALNSDKSVAGFASLKGGEFLKNEVKAWLPSHTCDWRIETAYHFGGYAKRTHALDEFITRSRTQHGIDLDPVYTGKMMFGVIDAAVNGAFPRGSRVLALHTGGLQAGLLK